MVKNSFVFYTKAHVHTRDELTTASADTTLYLSYRHLFHIPPSFAHQVEGVELWIGLQLSLSGKLQNCADVEVGKEKIWVGALKENH